MTLWVPLKMKLFCKDDSKCQKKEKKDYYAVQLLPKCSLPFKSPLSRQMKQRGALPNHRVFLIAAAMRGRPAGGEC